MQHCQATVAITVCVMIIDSAALPHTRGPHTTAWAMSTACNAKHSFGHSASHTVLAGQRSEENNQNVIVEGGGAVRAVSTRPPTHPATPKRVYKVPNC